MARKLIVEILGDTSGLDRSMRHAKGSVEGLTGAVGKLRVGFGTLARSVVVVELVEKALEGLHEAIHAGTEEISERAKVQAQLNAILKSTGNVAHVSKEGVDELALSLSNLSGIDDEIIKGGEAVLLQFTNIRNFAGKNNDVFDRATKVAVDFSVKSGRSIQAASLAIGKALQDPAKASTSLRRAQVVLTASEKQAIAVAIRHRDTLAAQKLVLDDLAKRYGGQAKALGETLPGQIAILKQRLRDLAGDLGDRIVPALSAAAGGAVDFVRKLSEAEGARAKLHVVFEGLQDLGAKLVDAVRAGIQKGVDAVEAIDWGEVKLRLRAGLDRAGEISRHLYEQTRQAISDGIERLRRVDWNAEIDRVARSVGDALVASLVGLRHALDRVNWNQVGRAILLGIEAALYAVGRFLAKLPWGKIADQIGRLLVAALRAARSIFFGIADELERQLEQALGAALRGIGRFLEKMGLEIAQKIIYPFTLLPRRLGGGWARDLQAKIQAQLDSLATTTEKSGEKAGKAYVDGFHHGFDRDPAAAPKPRRKGDDGLPSPTALPPPPAAGGIARNRQRLIDLRNRWFDAAIGRELDKLSDLPIRRQIAALRKVASEIEHRIAITKDITRKLELEDRLRGVLRQIKTTKEQLANTLVDALEFDVEKAGATQTLTDDLRALRKLEAYLKERIRLVGHTLDLDKQLFAAEQQIADVQAQRRQARQFRVLGLGAEGEELIPSASQLRRHLKRALDAIEGTTLDTPKLRAKFAKIASLLSGAFGKVGEEVRKTIDDILDSVDESLKQHQVEQTKFAKRSPNAFIAALGLNLSPQQARRLRAGLAAAGPNLTLPHGSGQYAAAGATGVVINGPVHVHGVQDIKHLEQQLTKRTKQRPHVRRGAR